MAELTDPDCCGTERQAACCEPEAKADCCGRADGCGCDADASRAAGDVRDDVRERYAAAARAIAAARSGPVAPAAAASAGGRVVSTADATGRQVFGGALYDSAEAGHAPRAAVAASLGCGVPTAVADLKQGETVLDLGSGAGADVLISARRVGPSGKAIGLDMTDEMLELARVNAAEAGVENVDFHEHAVAAIIRARKPAAAGCCEPEARASCCEPEHKDDCWGAPSAGAPSPCGCQP